MSDLRCLYVLRHAKSSWDEPGQPDHERPLAPRGCRAVKLLAEHLEASRIQPELVLCSPARRTRETLEGIALGGQAVIEPLLYGASAGQLIDRLREVPDEIGSVMVIGHNPAMQMLALRLAQDDETSGDLAEVQRKFSTGALATLSFPEGWGELRSGCAELTGYVRPKALLYQ